MCFLCMDSKQDNSPFKKILRASGRIKKSVAVEPKDKN